MTLIFTTPMSESSAPRDTKVISLILRSLGIEECEPKAILQIHEFVYKYATDVMKDASQYAEMVDRQVITEKDIKLALQTKVGRYFVPPPPRAYMNDIGTMVNSRPIRPHGEGANKLPMGKNTLLNFESRLIDENEM